MEEEVTPEELRELFFKTVSRLQKDAEKSIENYPLLSVALGVMLGVALSQVELDDVVKVARDGRWRVLRELLLLFI
ncbi:MAG: hypothetical protein ACE5K0_10900 [Candidatus Methanofastidiosia archaeon]